MSNTKLQKKKWLRIYDPNHYELYHAQVDVITSIPKKGVYLSIYEITKVHKVEKCWHKNSGLCYKSSVPTYGKGYALIIGVLHAEIAREMAEYIRSL